MMMVGAAAGIGMYMGMENLSKNKKVIKKKINSIARDTANMMD